MSSLLSDFLASFLSVNVRDFSSAGVAEEVELSVSDFFSVRGNDAIEGDEIRSVLLVKTHH